LWNLSSKPAHVLTEFGANDVNQLNAVPDSDNENNLPLYIYNPSVTDLRQELAHVFKVVLLSSPVDLTKSGILNPLGYGTVSKYSG
jgi:hypothetical protein